MAVMLRYEGLAKGCCTQRQIEDYGKFLISKISEAQLIVKRCVDDESFSATKNHCHDNVDEYCNINKNANPIRGWICVDAVASPFVIFVSHSIVRMVSGELIDITPMNKDLQEYKFLPSYLNDEEFAELVEHLFVNQGNTNIMVKNPHKAGF
ncbi:hypothetical protein [Limnohabitans radicicola]|uniref:Uncharacterized protein n=1 Tax=Limnohabitans radicicola TaxID=2771427 RepID=A0A927IKA1_9BURK|nr:hypothetical protein [Limnohabitans radicicola]MBD8049403.1 hypothetical protein [Limnohabitans radicicola]